MVEGEAVRGHRPRDAASAWRTPGPTKWDGRWQFAGGRRRVRPRRRERRRGQRAGVRGAVHQGARVREGALQPHPLPNCVGSAHGDPGRVLPRRHRRARRRSGEGAPHRAARRRVGAGRRDRRVRRRATATATTSWSRTSSATRPTPPHLELVQEVPGSVWECNEHSNLHHIGVWIDALPGDSHALHASAVPAPVVRPRRRRRPRSSSRTTAIRSACASSWSTSRCSPPWKSSCSRRH